MSKSTLHSLEGPTDATSDFFVFPAISFLGTRLRLTVCLFAFLALRVASGQVPSYRVDHYFIQARLEPALHRLDSRAVLTVVRLDQDTLHSINLRLVADSILGVADGDDSPLPYAYSENVLSIELPHTLESSTRLSVAYRGVFLGRVSNRIDPHNSWLLHESLWYPQPDDLRASSAPYTFHLEVTAPESLTVVSSGQLLKTLQSGSDKTFVWGSSLPVRFISLSAAVYDTASFRNGPLSVKTYLYGEETKESSRLATRFEEILVFYENLFGPYPYRDFKIVEVDRRGGYGAPGMILLNRSHIVPPEDSSQLLMGIFVLAHEAAHQWWGNKVGHDVDEPGGQFLTESLAQYSAYRYLEATGLIDVTISFRFLRLPGGIDVRTSLSVFELEHNMYHSPYEYRPISEVRIGDPDYVWAGYHKGAFALRSLAEVTGRSVFENALRTYSTEFDGRVGSLADLVAVTEDGCSCTLDSLVQELFYTTHRFDLSIDNMESTRLPDGSYKTTLEVFNDGTLTVPAAVRLIDDSDDTTWLRAQPSPGRSEQLGGITKSPVTRAVLDPGWRTFDDDRSNNQYPRDHRFVLLVSTRSPLPLEYYYGPSITFGATDGVRLGAWLTNAYPIESLKKVVHRWEWRLALAYATASARVTFSARMNTFFDSFSKRTSLGVFGEDMRGRRVAGVEMQYRWNTDHRIRLSVEREHLWDGSYYDPRDVTGGITSAARADYRRGLYGGLLEGGIGAGMKIFGSRFAFFRGSVSATGLVPPIRGLSIRLFAGFVRGDFPDQESVFLSGSVRPSSVAYWFVDPDRTVSTQAHMRVAGDASLRGFIGQHRRGKNGVSMTLDYAVPLWSPLRAFIEAGNVWDDGLRRVLWDAGIGVDFSAIRFDFPLIVSEPFGGQSIVAFRWVFEVKL